MESEYPHAGDIVMLRSGGPDQGRSVKPRAIASPWRAKAGPYVAFFSLLTFLGCSDDQGYQSPSSGVDSVGVTVTDSSGVEIVAADARMLDSLQCPRGPEIAITEKGAVREVVGSPPCRLVFRRTGVRLTAGDGSRPDPGPLLVRDGRGRYYSTRADGWGSTIGVWRTDGSYQSSFGRRGEGPGEFAIGTLSLFIDNGDSVHVRDSRNWSVFSPGHRFVRRATSFLVGSGYLLGEEETIAVLYDQKILASNAHSSSGDAYFRLVDRDGALDRTFGTLEEGTGTSGDYGHDRAISYRAADTTFWAAPSLQGAREYVLEQWEVPGRTLVQSLRRDAPWFKWTGDVDSSPGVRKLQITSDGLLYVQIWRPSEEFAEAMKEYRDRMAEGGWSPRLEQEMDALRESLTQVVVEVIDVRSAQLLAAATYPARDGLPYVDIIEGVLEVNPPSPPHGT